MPPSERVLTPEHLAVGVDVGGTKIAAALVTGRGELAGEIQRIPTPAHEGREAMLDAIAGLAARVVEAGVSRLGEGIEVADAAARPVVVGIGSAGVIDAERGVVTSATDAISEWPGTAICDGVARRLEAEGVRDPWGRVPLVHADNDVNAYAAGEAWLGGGAGAESALVVAVGTGVGGALILGGSVHHGKHFLAGEMGHMPSLMAAKERCTCGKYGHLEGIAAGPQIARRYREAMGGGADVAGVTTALEVEQRAGAGDEVAARVYREAAKALGHAIAQVCTVVDPEVVIVSGGLAHSGDLWWEPLRTTVREQLIDLIAQETVLVPATLGTTAPIVGAAHEAWLRWES